MDGTAAPVSNIPEYSVSDISGAVKRTLEGAFGRVRVRGEITELKRYPSGHIYFSLKDEGAKIAGIIWKSAVRGLGMVPENGVEVIATGRLTTYTDRSTYQLIVDRLDYAGAGALLARIEALRLRLADEGLFDAARKQALPMLPRVIGVVSSERGAVIQDIRTTIARRFPRHVLLWPVPVQGEGAAQKIAAAIRGFDAIVASGQGGRVARPDVLIVARGGGSLEDLMAFNDEAVIRAVADCRIPLISAVGHETDTTLIDFAADRRAPTPTAAAELAVPMRADLVAGLLQQAARLTGALSRLAQTGRLRLERAERGLPDLAALAGGARQRLDDRTERLSLALPSLVRRRRAALEQAGGRLPGSLRQSVARTHTQAMRVLARLSDAPLRALLAADGATLERCGGRLPGSLRQSVGQTHTRAMRVLVRLSDAPLRALLAADRATLERCGGRLPGSLLQSVARTHTQAMRVLARLSDAPVRAELRAARSRLDGLAGHLEAVSPLAILARGYALVTDAAGVPVTQAAEVTPGARLRLRFADASVQVTADGTRPTSRQGRLL